MSRKNPPMVHPKILNASRSLTPWTEWSHFVSLRSLRHATDGPGVSMGFPMGSSMGKSLENHGDMGNFLRKITGKSILWMEHPFVVWIFMEILMEI